MLLTLLAVLTFVGILYWISLPPKDTTRRKYFTTNAPIAEAIIRIGRILSFFSIRPIRLNKEDLRRKAIKAANVSDFGPRNYWEKAVDLIIESANEPKTGLSLLGHLSLNNFVYFNMYYRLLIQKHLQENRHIADIPIKPIFIIGMFRTGTTLLYNYTASRAPRSWEMMHPMPPPEKEVKMDDWRIVDAKRKSKLFPTDFNSIHYTDPLGIEEEFVIFGRNFWFLNLGWWGKGFESYRDWIHDAKGKNELYRDFRTFLQVLSTNYRPSSHWLLKSPIHLIADNFRELAKEFPDANFVWTHRKLPNVIASTCSLVRGLSQIYVDSYDPNALGQITLQELSDGTKNAIKARDELLKNEQVFDVQYDEFIKDPIEMIKGIYKQFELNYTVDFENRMRKYLADNPQGKHGSHKYSLEEFGLNEKQLEDAFAPYSQKYLNKN